jgi:ABC-2 type transport system permease protein
MYWTLLRKELRQLCRDRWLCGALLFFVLLVLVSLRGGTETYQVVATRQKAFQNAARNDWLSQDSTTGHSATHYGTSLYKVFSPLFAFDAGADPASGTTVRVESHHPYPMTDPLATGDIHPLNFDVSTPALLLQLVLPLLVILMTFSAVSGEREQGTLPMVLSSGVTWRHWMLAKMGVSLTILATLLFAPLTWLACWGCSIAIDAGISRSDLMSRMVPLALCTLLFLGGWSFVSLSVSARAQSSKMSLIILLTLWAGWSIIIPRLAVEFAQQKVPLPMADDLDREREEMAQYGHEGGSIYGKLRGEIDEKLMKMYGVSSAKELPLKMSALYLTGVEEFTDEIYDRQNAHLDELFLSQDRFLDAASWVSPYLAMRSLSTGFSGTDRIHHQEFYRAVEQYRRKLVRILNDYDAHNLVKEEPRPEGEQKRPEAGMLPSGYVPREKPGPDVWASVPAFEYRFPKVDIETHRLWGPMMVLLAWFFGTGLCATLAPRSTA